MATYVTRPPESGAATATLIRLAGVEKVYRACALRDVRQRALRWPARRAHLLGARRRRALGAGDSRPTELGSRGEPHIKAVSGLLERSSQFPCSTMQRMFKHTAHEQIASVVATNPHRYTCAGRGGVNALPRDLMRVAKVCASDRGTGPTITAVLQRGPLAGRRIDVDVVEGRPPKTIDATADDGSRCRYCLADWTQTGPSAIYTFLYLV